MTNLHTLCAELDGDLTAAMYLEGFRGDHHTDSDCTLDPETDCCIVCAVYHGEPCEVCGGRGYHVSQCPISDEATQ